MCMRSNGTWYPDIAWHDNKLAKEEGDLPARDKIRILDQLIGFHVVATNR